MVRASREMTLVANLGAMVEGDLPWAEVERGQWWADCVVSHGAEMQTEEAGVEAQGREKVQKTAGS